MKENLTLTNTTKGKLPRLPFVDVKNTILGKGYILSVVFIGDKKSRSLNKRYRKKDKNANVLSFPLSKNEGEIFINMRQAERDAKSFNMSHRSFILYLLIHGILHLKGMPHGSKMEKTEQKFQKVFSK